MNTPSQLTIDPSQLSDTPPVQVQAAGSSTQNVTSGTIDPSQLSDGPPTNTGSSTNGVASPEPIPQTRFLPQGLINKGGWAEKAIQAIDPDFVGGGSEVPDSLTDDPNAQAIGAAVNRFVHVPADIYGAFKNPPSTEELQHFQKLTAEQGPDAVKALAKNGGPGAASLAWYRLIEQPYDEGTEKATNTANAATASYKRGEYGKAANQELSAIAGQTLSDIPLVGPMINGIAERYENGDHVGAATDIALLESLEKSSISPKVKANIVSALAKSQKTAASLRNPLAYAKESLTAPDVPKYEPDVPGPVTPAVTLDTPLDDATIRKAMGGKDLSQEARDTLRDHVGDIIPRGSSPEVQLLKAVKPVNDAIVENGTALNDVLDGASDLDTNSFDPRSDNNIPDAISDLKENLPGSMEETLSKAIDKEVSRAEKAIGTTTDPTAINNYIRDLDNRISSYSAPEEPIDTAANAADATRVTIRRILRDKLNTDIPATQPLNDVLGKNIELRSLLRKRLGDIANNPVEADAQYRSEFNKGKTQQDIRTFNEVLKNQFEKHQQTVTANRTRLVGHISAAGLFLLGHPWLATLASGGAEGGIKGFLNKSFGPLEGASEISPMFTRPSEASATAASATIKPKLTASQTAALQRFLAAVDRYRQ